MNNTNIVISEWISIDQCKNMSDYYEEKESQEGKSSRRSSKAESIKPQDYQQCWDSQVHNLSPDAPLGQGGSIESLDD